MGEVPSVWRLIQEARTIETAREAVTNKYGPLPLIFVDDTHRVTLTAIDPGEMSNDGKAVLVRYMGGKRGKRPFSKAVHVNLLPRGVGY